MSEIYLIRHAKSEANDKHLYGTDAQLSLEGQFQCIQAREYYQAIKFDKIYSSTKLRASTTGTLVFQSPIPPDRQLKEFDEIYFGKAEGQPNTKTGIEGYTNNYQIDFKAFIQECEGDNIDNRVQSALIKMQELIIQSEKDTNNDRTRIAIITSDTLMRCILLTLQKQENWTNINDAEYIHNLDGYIFNYNNNELTSIRQINYTERPNIWVL